MSSRAAFRKGDLAKALAVVKAAGLTIADVVFHENGGFRIVTAEGRALTGGDDEETLERELAEHRRTHGHGQA